MQQIAQTEPFAFPSLIRDLPFETYLAIEAASASGIKTMLAKSPKHVREEPHKESDAMTLGTSGTRDDPGAGSAAVYRAAGRRRENEQRGEGSLCFESMRCDAMRFAGR